MKIFLPCVLCSFILLSSIKCGSDNFDLSVNNLPQQDSLKTGDPTKKPEGGDKQKINTTNAPPVIAISPEELAQLERRRLERLERLKEQKAIDELEGFKKIEKLIEVLNTVFMDSQIIALFKQLLKESETLLKTSNLSLEDINALSKSFQEGVSFVNTPIRVIEDSISDDEPEEDDQEAKKRVEEELKELKDGIKKVEDLITEKTNALGVDS